MQKYKGYYFINILGLAIGLACTVIILAFIQKEMTIDAHHLKRENISQAYFKLPGMQ